MKTLHYLVVNNLSLLHDEIQVAIPSLAPARDADGIGTPVMTVQGDDKNVWLNVPDSADVAAIRAVVNAHDATRSRPLNQRELARALAVKEFLKLGITEQSLRALDLID